MKRGVIILLVLFLISLQFVVASQITGQASSQPTGVSVFVLAAVPTLNILSPVNTTTYYSNEYILLNYQAILINTVWYNFDNTANTTITSPFYFQIAAGVHTLYLYGNQSNGTILSDNVTFSVAEPTVPSQGGGAKEVIIEEGIKITIDQEIINVVVKQGESEDVKLLVRNDYPERVKINLADLELDDLLSNISEIEFYLNPGESKEVVVTFTAGENKVPNLYLEKLMIFTPNSQKEVIFYIEVESKQFLFDVRVDIPREPVTYRPGENLLANVEFINLGGIGETEVEVQYIVEDLNGTLILGEKQILIIGTSLLIEKLFTLPLDIKEGEYIFYVKATYDSKTASASKLFTISTPGAVIQRLFKEMITNLKIGFERDKEFIAIAIAFLIGLYLILALWNILFGPGGKYYFLRERKIGGTAKKVLKTRYYYGKKRISEEEARKLMNKKNSKRIVKPKKAKSVKKEKSIRKKRR